MNLPAYWNRTKYGYYIYGSLALLWFSVYLLSAEEATRKPDVAIRHDISVVSIAVDADAEYHIVYIMDNELNTHSDISRHQAHSISSNTSYVIKCASDWKFDYQYYLSASDLASITYIKD